MKRSILLVLLAVAPFALAQKPKKHSTTSTPTQQTFGDNSPVNDGVQGDVSIQNGNVVEKAVPSQKPPADKPKTTELQDTQLELYIAKVNEIQTRYQAQMGQESAPWVQKASTLIDEIQKANPDFMWHQAANQQDRTGWIRKPQPAPANPAPSPAATPAPAAPAATIPVVPATTPKK